MKKQRRSFADGYIYANRAKILINICFVVLGVVFGCAVFMYAPDKQSFFKKISNSFDMINTNDLKNIFINAVWENVLICAVFYICSLFYIGTYISYAYVFVRAAACGFASCVIINSYAFCGICILAFAMMPYTALYMTAVIIFCVETVKQSRYISSCVDKSLKKRSVFTYFAATIVPVILLAAGSLVEGFAAPHIILWCMKKF